MRHHLFSDTQPSYQVALLSKSTAFRREEILKSYVLPLLALDVQPHNVLAMTLEYQANGKASAGFIKEYLDKLLPELHGLGVQYLYVTDGAYFKVLTKKPKVDPHHGYVLPCAIKGFEHMKVVLGINYQALIYAPALKEKLDLSLNTLASSIHGKYTELGTNIIHTAWYPTDDQSIETALEMLHKHPALTCDIEGFSLRFWEAGIGTIAFAWDEHNGIAFPCDYHLYQGRPDEGFFGYKQANFRIRRALLKFFSTYKGSLTFHNAPYDVKALIFALWMDENLNDTKGLLLGLDCLTAGMHDTKVIAYLATNTTAGNVLGLKPLAHEFAGNWAKEEITDIRKIPLGELLQYNLVDALSTWYVFKKYMPVMQLDNQLQLYNDLFMPSQKLIIQMEMTGMPMNKARIQEVKAQLEGMQAGYLDTIKQSTMLPLMEDWLTEKAWTDDYESRKAKAKNPDKIFPKPRDLFPRQTFNPRSGPQLRVLLYELMGLPVIDLTDTKMPATGAETIEKLVHHTSDPHHKALLEAFIGFGQVIKILDTFIPAFEQAIAKTYDGIVWLFGSFNLGGTVSGRLSSSDPNLQNLPANSIFGKLIKSLFMAPKGWLFCGADFNSLEDYVSALTTKDPNKLKVYEQGFDGHCLRAVMYFRDENEDLAKIDINDPKQVNSFKKDGHPLQPYRQESKTPTFALTYQGTYLTLMANLGWSKEKAKRVEDGYHELYKVSDQYVQGRLKQASVDGYVDVAFGLRVRTPLIKQVVWGNSHMPKEAAAEGRTAGNALGQSYGLLNNRAAVDFWEKVWASPYRYDILPCALIHDAIYPLIRDNVEIVEWANRELIKSMRWQELPELQHDTVKLGAALDVFYPDWAHPITLPNDGSAQEIQKVAREALTKQKEAA